MRKYIVAAVILYSTAAPAQEPKAFTLTVTQADITLIAQALGTRPFGEVAPLIKKLDEQLAEQNKPKPAEPPKGAETPEKESK